MTFAPRPVQTPRISIWVGGWWPTKAPLRRAARWDGVHPGKTGGAPTPGEVRVLVAYVQARRESDAPFDVAVGGVTPGDRPAEAAETTERVAEAGATWWLAVGGFGGAAMAAERVRERVHQGPPR